MRYLKEDSSLQQLSNIGTHGNTRIPNAEELIDKTSDSNKDDANGPSTESACGNGGIIVIIDDSAHFSVW